MRDRIAVITGASSGIGRATALRLAKKGVRMVLNGRDKTRLNEIEKEVNEISRTICSRIVCGNISNKDIADLCISECLENWKRGPDIYIASAGRGLSGTITSSKWEEWKDVVDINVTGLMYQLRSVCETMLQTQKVNDGFNCNPQDIVVIGSTVGRNVSPFNSIYGATKFAVHGLTEALRRELGPKGIRVSLIEPGLVHTNFQNAANYDMTWFSRYAQEVGPILTADDIARVICFLLELPENVHLDNVSIRPTRQAYP